MTFSCLDHCPSNSPTHAVVLLHGWGANAKDLASIAPYLNFPKISFLFPNAPHSHPYSAAGRMWYDLETQDYLTQTRHDLKAWVQELPHQLNLPLHKIMLGGFSQGGAMTLDVGHNLGLGGLLCLSGYLHPHIQFDSNQNKPTLVIHGTQDPVVPIHAARSIQTKMAQAQWEPEVHELPMAHEISPQALDIIRDFLGRICCNAE